MASTFTLPSGKQMSYNFSPAPPTGPVVLLANSLLADHRLWDHVAKNLITHGFRPLCFDQPGHGQSSVPQDLLSTTFETLAADVEVLLDHLNITTVHAWIGVSMGAATSIYFVAQNPGVVNKLVVCDTILASPVNTGIQDAFASRVEAARKEGSLASIREQTLERWFGKWWMDANKEETSRMRALMESTTVDGFETCCAALSSPTFDLGPLLSKSALGCNDALLVVGEKDADLPVLMRDMQAKIQQSFLDAGTSREVTLEVIPGAGHVPFIDGFAGFCSAVIPFLQK